MDRTLVLSRVAAAISPSNRSFNPIQKYNFQTLSSAQIHHVGFSSKAISSIRFLSFLLLCHTDHAPQITATTAQPTIIPIIPPVERVSTISPHQRERYTSVSDTGTRTRSGTRHGRSFRSS